MQELRRPQQPLLQPEPLRLPGQPGLRSSGCENYNGRDECGDRDNHNPEGYCSPRQDMVQESLWPSPLFHDEIYPPVCQMVGRRVTYTKSIEVLVPVLN